MSPKKIALTGVESTGKTTLAKALAAHFQTVWVPEYARDYLPTLKGRKYTIEELLYIAQRQQGFENQAISKVNRFLFCDTDLLVCKIWAMVEFGYCPEWIENQLQTNPYDLYILCDMDIPWEYDPLRQTPQLEQRQDLMNMYKLELSKQSTPFLLVSGSVEERVEQVKKRLELFL